jgi:hypothetical protein
MATQTSPLALVPTNVLQAFTQRRHSSDDIRTAPQVCPYSLCFWPFLFCMQACRLPAPILLHILLKHHARLLCCCCCLQAAAAKVPTVSPPANRGLHSKPISTAGAAPPLPARRATRLSAAPSQATAAVAQQAPAAKANATPGSGRRGRGKAQAAAPKPAAAAAAAATPMASFSRKRQLHGDEDCADVSGGVQHQPRPSKQARRAPAAGKAELLFDSLFEQDEEDAVPQQQVLPATQQPVWAASQPARGSQPEAGWGGRANDDGGGDCDCDLAAAVQRRMEMHKAKMAQSRRRGSLSRRQLEQEE